MERGLGQGSSKLGALSSSVLICDFGQVSLSFHISKIGHNILPSLYSTCLHCCGETETRQHRVKRYRAGGRGKSRRQSSIDYCVTQWALGKRHPCWVTSTTAWSRPVPVFFLWTTLPFVGLHTAQRFSPTRKHHCRASGELKASLKHHSGANPESGPSHTLWAQMFP